MSNENNQKNIKCGLCGKEFQTYTRMETHYHDYEPYEVEVPYPEPNECHLVKEYICNDCFDNLSEVVRDKMISSGVSYIEAYPTRVQNLKEKYKRKLQQLEEENQKVGELLNNLRTADMNKIAKDNRYLDGKEYPYSHGTYYLDSLEQVNGGNKNE